MLEFSGNVVALERTDKGIKKCVVAGIKAVKNGSRKSVSAVQFVKKTSKRIGTVLRSDAIETGIGTEFFEHCGVGVTNAVVMDLHYPAVFCIFFRTENKQCGFEHGCFLCGNAFAGKTFFNYRIDFAFACGFENHMVKTVVTGFAAVSVEMFDPFQKGIFKRIKVGDFGFGNCGKSFDIFFPAGFVDIKSFIGTERRSNNSFETVVRGNFFVPFKRIHRIVGSSDKSYAALFDKSADAHVIFGKFFLGEIPDLLCGFTGKNAFITEIVFQFKVAPMIKGISDSFGKGFCEFFEFFKIGSVSGDIMFVNAVGTHKTPFIMVTGKPYLRYIFEMLVFKNLFGTYVAMIVDYRHFCSEIMVKSF